MAEVYVRNSLNPYKVVKVGISFIQTISKNRYDGELIWVLEVGTPELDFYGNKIPPTYINNLNLRNIDKEIENAVRFISSKVDWGFLEYDNKPPFVDSLAPVLYKVDMSASVDLVLKETLPSSGIDKDSINIEVNGFDVSDELSIYGNPFEYRVIWHPKIKVFNTYV